jgi:hypothetical protein
MQMSVKRRTSIGGGHACLSTQRRHRTRRTFGENDMSTPRFAFPYIQTS